MNHIQKSPKVKVRYIPVVELLIHVSTQKDLDEVWVDRRTNDWSWEACGVLTVASIEGRFWTIDGQHRKTAAQLIGIKALPCHVIDGLSETDLVKLALEIADRTQLKSHDYHTWVGMTGDELAKGLDQILEDYGWSHGAGNKPRSIAGIKYAREKLYPANPDLLEEIIAVLNHMNDLGECHIPTRIITAIFEYAAFVKSQNGDDWSESFMDLSAKQMMRDINLLKRYNGIGRISLDFAIHAIKTIVEGE